MFNQISNRFWQYVEPETGMTFSLKYGRIGVLAAGNAWFLTCQNAGCGVQQNIATFCTKSDGYKMENECYEGRLFSGINEILAEAEKVAARMVEANNPNPQSTQKTRLQELLVNSMQAGLTAGIQLTDLLTKMGTSLTGLASLGVDIDRIVGTE